MRNVYAVVRTGSKQHRVAEGDTVIVERITGEAGDSVELTDVMLISTDKGTVADRAALAKAKVHATIVGQVKDDKVLVFKFRRRKGYKRTRGHRQLVTELVIDQIDDGTGKAPSKARTKTAKADAKTEAAPPKPKAAAKAKPAAKPRAKAETKAKPAAKRTTEAKTKTEPKAEAGVKAPAKKATAAKKTAAKGAEAEKGETKRKKSPAKKKSEQ